MRGMRLRQTDVRRWNMFDAIRKMTNEIVSVMEGKV